MVRVDDTSPFKSIMYEVIWRARVAHLGACVSQGESSSGVLIHVDIVFRQQQLVHG